jgi:hypothetical protein
MGASSSSHENSHGTYSTSDAELYDAACDDDLGKIKKLLADGAQPDRYRHQSVSHEHQPANTTSCCL